MQKSPSGRAFARPVVRTLSIASGRAVALWIVAALAFLSTSDATAAPAILAINPSSGPAAGAGLLTLTGANFSPTANSVTVDGNTCLPLSEGTSQIICRVPAGTGASNDVQVIDDSGAASNIVNYLYDGPDIYDINPLYGEEAGGTVITLTGVNFGRPQDDALRTVAVGAAGVCIFAGGANSDGEVHCTMPPGTGSDVDVTITVDGQTSGAVQFDYLPPPSVSGVNPSSGATDGGFAITISGDAFKSSGNTVTVGGNPCPVTNESPTQIVCTLPEGLGADREILVTAGGGTGGGASFDYSPPSITSITPDHGPTEGNVPITIQGANFGPASADAMRSVKVGLTDCPLLASASGHHEIQCTLPEGEGAGLGVQVTVAGQTSNVQTLDYDPPTIDSITPARASALGGDRITIHGHNFGTDATLRIRGGAYDNVSAGHSEIVFDAPPDAGGVAPVVVEVSGQVAGTTLEFVVPLCGDAYQDTVKGEVCDDGNIENGDGCSADCRSEHNPTKEEVSCILAMNKAAAGIFKAQTKDHLLCATRGDGSPCVGASESAGVTKAKDKAADVSGKKCPSPPTFGSASLAIVQSANGDEPFWFMHSLFAGDPDAELADSALEPGRARCQNDVLKAEHKYMNARLKAFGKCKKAGFKEGTILTDSQLADCLETADDDPAMAKPTAAQFQALIDSCLNLEDDGLSSFKGCSSAPDLGICISSLARCHTCLALKKTDSLWIDCDVDDDGTVNATCGDD